jgi:hypothetical protein
MHSPLLSETIQSPKPLTLGVHEPRIQDDLWPLCWPEIYHVWARTLQTVEADIFEMCVHVYQLTPCHSRETSAQRGSFLLRPHHRVVVREALLLSQRSSNLFFREGTPKITVHIPRNPCLRKRKKNNNNKNKNKRVLADGDYSNISKCRKKILAISRGI